MESDDPGVSYFIFWYLNGAEFFAIVLCKFTN
jgi:hypothetical protein